VCEEKFLLAKKHIPHHKGTVSRDFSKIREDIRNPRSDFVLYVNDVGGQFSSRQLHLQYTLSCNFEKIEIGKDNSRN
jgi:hypothetical protein